MRLRNNGVFTLVEISVALLILAIGFASLMAVFTVGIKWSGDTIAASSASLTADSVIEYTCTYNFGTLGSNPYYMTTRSMGYSMRIYNNSYPFDGGGSAIKYTDHNKLMSVYVVAYPNDRAMGDQANTICIYQKFKFIK